MDKAAKDRFDKRKTADATKKGEEEAAQMQKMRQRAEAAQALERGEWAEEKRRKDELEQAKKDKAKARTAEMEERAAAAQVSSWHQGHMHDSVIAYGVL